MSHRDLATLDRDDFAVSINAGAQLDQPLRTGFVL
jgi:hypothetical protein